MTTHGGAATIQQTQIFINAPSFAGEATQFANLIAEDIQRAGLAMPVALPSPPDTVSSEDPVNNVLDRQIDALREMLRDGKPNTAMIGLHVLLGTLPGVASPRSSFASKPISGTV